MGVTTTPQESKRTDKKHPCSHTVTHSFANNLCSLYDQIFKRKGHSTPTCIRSTSRTATVLSEKLGSPNKGQVDPRNSKGLQNRIQREPQAAGQTSPNAIQSITRRPHTTGGIRASNKRGNQADCRGIPSRGREFLFDPFLGPKKRWRPEAGHQPESPKPVCHSTTLQDGGHSHPKNPLETRRLASENRPQGRLLCHPNSGRKQEIPKLFDGGQKLPIHLSPLRPCISSMGLYQDPQAGSSSRSRAWGETSDLYRRHASHGGIQGESGRSGFRSNVPPTVPRVHNKHEKIGAGPNPISRVPRLSGQLLNNGVKPPNRQTKKDQGGVTEVTRGGANYKPRPFKTNRQNECCQSGDSPLSSVLQTPTNGPDGVLESLGSKLRDYTHESKEELTWWDTQMSKWNGRHILAKEPDLVIESDASTLGWGASCQNINTGGPWSAQEKTNHINCLELLAATLALKTFVKNQTGVSVLLKIDNTTAVAYINNQRGTVSKTLVTLTRDLWMWCLERNIHIQAQHLPGVLNYRVDTESRTLKDRSDWRTLSQK